MGDTILGIPINRFVTFVKPYINWLTALLAAWLVAKVNVFGIAGLDQSNLQTYLGFALTGGLVAGLHFLADNKWLNGHHIELLGGGVEEEEDDEEDDDELPEEVASGDLPVDDTSKVPPDEGDSGGL